MSYRTLTPMEAYNQQQSLVGKSMAYAYWLRWDDTARQANIYAFRFRVLRLIVPGPHAYTLLFRDGSQEVLTSYDTVCVYDVTL